MELCLAGRAQSQTRSSVSKRSWERRRLCLSRGQVVGGYELVTTGIFHVLSIWKGINIALLQTCSTSFTSRFCPPNPSMPKDLYCHLCSCIVEIIVRVLPRLELGTGKTFCSLVAGLPLENPSAPCPSQCPDAVPSQSLLPPCSHEGRHFSTASAPWSLELPLLFCHHRALRYVSRNHWLSPCLSYLGSQPEPEFPFAL